MRIVTVLGARPQFVKAAVVSPHVRKRHEEYIVHTGQHYDYEMSDIFFKELGVPRADVNLGIGGGTRAEQVGRMLPEIERVLRRRKPDCVLVYGDTNSTLAGALAGATAGIAVAHAEAGARLFDLSLPEEVNRVVTDRVATGLFAVTRGCVENLRREGITRGVVRTGDPMLDLARRALPVAEKRSDALKRYGLEKGKYTLVTLHRAGNVDEREALERIVGGLERLGEAMVFPVHPRTRDRLGKFRLLKRLERAEGMRLTAPLGYLDVCVLTRHAGRVVTDSGGVQREAYFHGSPCVVLRSGTEWTEIMEAGWSVCVDFSRKGDVERVRKFRAPEGRRPAIFGDGDAGEKIAKALDGMEKRLSKST